MAAPVNDCLGLCGPCIDLLVVGRAGGAGDNIWEVRLDVAIKYHSSPNRPVCLTLTLSIAVHTMCVILLGFTTWMFSETAEVSAWQ